MHDNFLTVSTFLWEDKERRRSYSIEPEHVVILRNMVRRNLTVPHEFVCVTDRRSVANVLEPEGIRCVPLIWDKHVPGTCFVRLMLRHPRIGGVLGRRILNLDVDMVVVGNIDHIATRKEANVWWKNPNFGTSASRAYFQTSVQLLTAGTLTELWKDFDVEITPKWVNRRFGGAEQAFVSEMISWDSPVFTDADGIYGAGRLFKGAMDNGVGTALPENACIVSLPGDRAPWQADIQRLHPWIGDHWK